MAKRSEAMKSATGSSGRPANGSDPFELDGEQPPDPLDDLGEDVEELTVTWGRQHVQPVQYQGMDVGPFSLTLRLREGETLQQAYNRGMARLEEMARRDYEHRLPKFIDRIRDAVSQARGA